MKLMFGRLLAAASLAVLMWGQALEEGKRAFDAQDYVAAERLFEKAYQKSPACEALVYLGMARYRQQQINSALIAFQQAVRCDPAMVLGHVALGEAYATKGNDTEAIAAYENALKLDPNDIAALHGVAAIYTRDKLHLKAVGVLQTLVKLEPANAQVHADLGASYFTTGNQDGAQAQFEESLRLK